MSIYCLLNDEKYKVPFGKFYNPLLLIDVKALQMKCTMTNTFLFFIEHPRTNMELVSGFLEFYFKSAPDDFTLGQVVSKTMIFYSRFRNSDCEFMPCILFTCGFFLQEILIYLPSQTFPFHRELKYHFLPKHPHKCAVCLESLDCYNVHQNHFDHMVCPQCLFRFPPQCPVCRISII